MRKILVNPESIKIDQGYFFGKVVFETINCLDKPILLDDHLERLSSGLKMLNLKEIDKEAIKEQISKLNIKNKVLKITVSDENIIFTERDNPYINFDYNKSMSLTKTNVLRNSTSILSYIKSGCYIENIIEKNNAIKKGFNDALFTNEKNNVAETSCANIFFVKGEKIITSKIEDGILSGIIRKWVIDNFEVFEKNISYNNIEEFDEVFITNSLMGIVNVNKIDNITYDNRKITDKLMMKYKETVQLEE